MLPTPTASNAGNDMTLTKSGDGRTKPNKLGWAAAMLPTPNRRDGEPRGAQNPDERKAQGHQVSLADAVCGKMYPTPRASDGDPRRGEHGADPNRMKPGKARLVDEVASGQKHLRLNPRFVEAMMGLPRDWTLVEEE